MSSGSKICYVPDGRCNRFIYVRWKTYWEVDMKKVQPNIMMETNRTLILVRNVQVFLERSHNSTGYSPAWNYSRA